MQSSANRAEWRAQELSHDAAAYSASPRRLTGQHRRRASPPSKPLIAAGRLVDMDVYEQDAELRLLSSLLSSLEHRTMIDVGAELGAVAEHILEAHILAEHIRV